MPFFVAVPRPSIQHPKGWLCTRRSSKPTSFMVISQAAQKYGRQSQVRTGKQAVDRLEPMRRPTGTFDHRSHFDSHSKHASSLWSLQRSLRFSECNGYLLLPRPTATLGEVRIRATTIRRKTDAPRHCHCHCPRVAARRHHLRATFIRLNDVIPPRSGHQAVGWATKQHCSLAQQRKRSKSRVDVIGKIYDSTRGQLLELSPHAECRTCRHSRGQ